LLGRLLDVNISKSVTRGVFWVENTPEMNLLTIYDIILQGSCENTPQKMHRNFYGLCAREGDKT